MKLIKNLRKKYKQHQRAKNLRKIVKIIKKKFLNKDFLGKIVLLIVVLAMVAGFILPYIA